MSNSASVQNISTRNTEKTELRFVSLNSSAGKANLSFQHDTTSTNRLLSLGIDNTNLLFLKNSNVGISVSTPVSKLDVNGTLGLREIASPDAPSASNGGVLWTSTDGKLYFKSNEISSGIELSDHVVGTNIGTGIGGVGVYSEASACVQCRRNEKNVDFRCLADFVLFFVVLTDLG